VILEWKLIIRDDQQNIISDPPKTAVQDEASVLLVLLTTGALSRMMQEKMNIVARELQQEPA